MSSSTSKDTLLQALQALYHVLDPDIKTAANNWLEHFQNTVEAWQISDSFLHDSSCSLEVHYFCAQTLRTKSQRDYEELPAGAGVSLRDSLLALLRKFRHGPPLVRTQLSLAVAALAVHMPAAEWGNGEGIIKWVKAQLSSEPDDIPWLLELLTVVPQEAGSDKVAVRPERRRQYSAELVAAVHDALDLLVVCHEQSRGSDVLLCQVLEAFATWLRLSSGVSAAILASHPLTLAALNGLGTASTFDAAVDAVCELIRYTVSGPTPGGDLPAHMPLVGVLAAHVMSLVPRFEAAVKRAEQEARGVDDPKLDGPDEDEDTTKGIARVLADMGEAFVDLIATGTDEAMMITHALAIVTSHPDNDIAATTFNFWHRLSNALTVKARVDASVHSAGEAAVAVEKERRLALFRPVFERLVDLVSFRVRYPEGFEMWRRDERSDFKHTRYAVADVLMDVCGVLGGEATITLLWKPLYQVAAGASSGRWEWRTAEAALYCIRAIAKAVPLTEQTLLPQIMALVPQLPVQPQLLYTSALTIAAYSDWLGAARNAPVLLPPLLTLLTRALSATDDVPPAAALAIKHVCDACRSLLVASVAELIQVYQRVMAGAAVSEDAPLHLDSDDELQIVEAVSIVVSSLPADQVRPALDALCLPVVSSLQQLVSGGQQGGGGGGAPSAIPARLLILEIDRIANIFRYVNQPQPLAGVFEQMWPILKFVFEQRGTDTRVMERLCRACKYAIRSCGQQLAPALGTLLQVIEQQFSLHLQPCLLYTASELIKVHGGDTALADPLRSLLNLLFATTIGQLHTIQEFTRNPELADDCFLLASRCLRYCPRLLVSAPTLPPLLDCAMTGITIQHREACRSILGFLVEVLELPLYESAADMVAPLEAVIMPRGEALTRILLAALAGALPEPRIDNVVDVLQRLAQLCGQRVVQWANAALSRIPASVMNNGEKGNFVIALSAAANGVVTQPLSSTLAEMSDLCRRNKKVIEVVQAALQPQVLALTGMQ